MINTQIQNMIKSLENIRFQINNSFITSDLLITDGFDLIYKGIQILNIYLQSLNSKMDMKLNFKLQIQNIGFELQNIVIQFQKYEFIQNMGNQNLNYGMNQAFNQDINMMMQNIMSNIPQDEMKSIIFEWYGFMLTITLPANFTVGKAIEPFFERCPQINKNKSYFLYSARKINVIDNTKNIKDFFIGFNPKVFAFDDKHIVIG